MIRINYEEVLEQVKQGKSLNQIAKEKGYCRQNMYTQLKKKYPKQYDSLIYGEIIDYYHGYELRKMPKRQTNRTECNITKEAKQWFIEKFNAFEEVGVWSNNFTKRYTIDLYLRKHKLGIELVWRHQQNMKKFIKRIYNYKKFCKHVVVALLKDSTWRTKNRSYFCIKQRLSQNKIDWWILDVSKPHTLTDWA